jgi:hypothetical protein
LKADFFLLTRLQSKFSKRFELFFQVAQPWRIVRSPRHRNCRTIHQDNRNAGLDCEYRVDQAIVPGGQVERSAIDPFALERHGYKNSASGIDPGFVFSLIFRE